MQWNSSENGGFSTGKPWIKSNPNFSTVNVSSDKNSKNSIFRYYQKLLGIRKKFDVAVYGSFELLDPLHKDVFAYERDLWEEKLIVIANFYDKPTSFNAKRKFKKPPVLLLSNYGDVKISDDILQVDIGLRPFETLIFYVDK
jgi:glycosidase